MPTPSDPQMIAAIIQDACCGDEHAEAYLASTLELVALADDLADETMTFESRQAYVVRLLAIAYFDLPNNPFYMRYAQVLAPLVMNILLTWKKSDEWKQRGDLRRKMFGFVWRENIDGIVVAVAAILGGAEHAEHMIERMMDHHEAGAETFDDWVKEGKP